MIGIAKADPLHEEARRPLPARSTKAERRRRDAFLVHGFDVKPPRWVAAKADERDWSIERIREEAAPLPLRVVCGVYFLLDRGWVAYVGLSRHVVARVAQHLESDKQFDAVAIFECPTDRLGQVEGYYIRKFQPFYNADAPRRYEMFAAHCMSLGHEFGTGASA